MRRTLSALVVLAALPVAGHAIASDPVTSSEEAARIASATACRQAEADTGVELDCDGIDGRTWTDADVAASAGQRLVRALTLQDRLAYDLPLGDATVFATHNSFNSSAYGLSLSAMDPNHVLTITDQLAHSVRGLELDVHWFGNRPVLCHGTAQHAGCSDDRTLREGLVEIREWLDTKPNAIVVIDIEEHLDGTAGLNAAADVIETELGPLVFRPADHAAGACGEIPLGVTRESIRTTPAPGLPGRGKQVLLYSGCDAAGAPAWGALVHSSGNREQQVNSGGWGQDPLPCVYSTSSYLTKWVRFWEDSTWLSASAKEVGLGDPGAPIDVDTLAAMARCGVNMPSIDQLVPFDERLQSLLWSWGSAQPSSSANGRCAAHGSDSRFRSAACFGTGTEKRVACYRADRNWWYVPRITVRWRYAAAVCDFFGYDFAVPRSPAENIALAKAKARTASRDIWLAYKVVPGQGWVATDR